MSDEVCLIVFVVAVQSAPDAVMELLENFAARESTGCPLIAH